MVQLPSSLMKHRVRAANERSVVDGRVRYAPAKSAWLSLMVLGASIGGAVTFRWSAVLVFVGTTATVLLLGHSLGSHRKLIHDSYQCPRWLEYLLVYCGVQVGLAGPLGLLRQHELRDYAQRLPDCHPYLRHGSSFWRDGWWQLHCELALDNPPPIVIEPRIASDRFYRFLERTWQLQQLLPAILLYAWGGWAFVAWGVCGRVSAGVLGHWLIGHFAHNIGARHYDVAGAAVQGRNILGTSLLTMGESWHNNHHAFPGSSRLGLYAGEWDPGWWLLMVFRRLGLVWDLRLPADLPARAELLPLDAVGATALLARHASAHATARTRLNDIVKQCLRGRRATRAYRYRLRGAAATVSVRLMRKIVGRGVLFTARPALSRLTLAVGGRRIHGLPALCVAFSSRGTLCAAIGGGLAPLAVAIERLRESLDVG